MGILQHQHSCSGRPNFSMHSACSRQWPGGGPSKCTSQPAGSAPARARGRAMAPACGDGRGEREQEKGVAREPRERGRARAEKCTRAR